MVKPSLSLYQRPFIALVRRDVLVQVSRSNDLRPAVEVNQELRQFYHTNSTNSTNSTAFTINLGITNQSVRKIYQLFVCACIVKLLSQHCQPYTRLYGEKASLVKRVLVFSSSTCIHL